MIILLPIFSALILGLTALDLVFGHEDTRAVPVGTPRTATRVAKELWNEWQAQLFSRLGGLLVLVLVLVLVVALAQFDEVFSYFQRIVHCRYGLLSGAALVFLVPLGLVVAPSLTRALFVLKRPWQEFHISWMSLLAGAAVLASITVAEINLAARYTDPAVGTFSEHTNSWSWVQLLALLSIAAPTPVTCVVLSKHVEQTPGSWAAWLTGLVGGFVAGALMLLVLDLGLYVSLSETGRCDELLPFQEHTGKLARLFDLPRVGWLDDLADFLKARAYVLGENGYVDKESHQLAPGHIQVIGGVGIAFVIYLTTYVWVTFRRPAPDQLFWLPSLFYVLLLIGFLGLILQGLAFWLDRFYVPPLLAVAIYVYTVYQISRTDHFFRLLSPRKGAATAPSASSETWERLARTWEVPACKGKEQEDAKRTLVAVSASGGGIQATAWITRVLVGLHRRYGADFTRSVRLLSAVSGGSVGVLYYLDRWNEDDPEVFDTEAVATPTGDNMLPVPNSIGDAAMASSLEGTAWGLAFPDLLRIVFPLIVSRTDDRGMRIEQLWRSRLLHPERTVCETLPTPGKRSPRPVVVYNSTVVETGQRMLFSPVLGSSRKQRSPDNSRELLELYPGADLFASTAALLSATFPYVSPICRPLEANGPTWNANSAYHFCDGGYVDNEGMFTILDWLRHLINNLAPERRLFDRILLVRLMPFPQSVTPENAKRGRGWFYEFLGPLDALQHARTASQTERNNLAVTQFIDWAKGVHRVEATEASFFFESPLHMKPPLSWMLTDAQKTAIEDAWQDILAAKNGPLRILDQFFAPRS